LYFAQASFKKVGYKKIIDTHKRTEVSLT